ncbi:uncharacterized protein si:ch211-153f2.3 [Notolabrus celidotus]|uniref:uncharacterized protein si:ch211-153f2.3 n=1 Tax=Notolabrus celidotus TaxID=1203425 RepID=UPI00148F6A98|nr:uncharacterized protein si:ch211-153f2.3 [Notolabrus celidotus]
MQPQMQAAITLHTGYRKRRRRRRTRRRRRRWGMQAEGTFSIVTMTKQGSSTAGRQKGRLQLQSRSTQISASEESGSHKARKKTSLDPRSGIRRFPKFYQSVHRPVKEIARRQQVKRGLKRTVHLPPSMDRDSHSEDTLSTMVLENIKNKLINAFRATGESREQRQESGKTVRPVSIGRSYQANEELRRAQIDGAITWLRSELLEMRSQDLQLAQTLLGLNTEIQRLRRESFGGMEIEGEDQP